MVLSVDWKSVDRYCNCNKTRLSVSDNLKWVVNINHDNLWLQEQQSVVSGRESLFCAFEAQTSVSPALQRHSILWNRCEINYCTNTLSLLRSILRYTVKWEAMNTLIRLGQTKLHLRIKIYFEILFACKSGKHYILQKRTSKQVYI